ncbi:cache domain-containing sensor histidine kinase [Ammoniphilus resinae]|nr:sensor histidine kinase [Ammoniphilus resinae]
MYTFFANLAEKQSETETKLFLNQVNKNLTSHLDEIRRISLLPDFDSSIQEGLNHPKIMITENTKPTDNLYATMNAVTQFRMLPFCSGATIFHKNGTLLLSQYFSPINSHLKRPLNQEQWFQTFIHDQTKTSMYITESRWADLHENPDSYFNNWAFSYMQKLYSYPGHVFNGILVLDFKQDLFEQVVHQSEKQGLYPHFFVYHPQQSEFLYESNPKFMTKDIEEMVKTGSNVTQTVDKTINGSDYFVTYKNLEGSPWVLISTTSKAEMLQEAQVVYKTIAGVLLFCILFSILLSVLFSRRLTQPILELQKLMGRVESGNLQVRYQQNRNDEIGYLGNSFNHMLNELDKTLYKSYMLELLRSQIHPHFLYNTLGTIASIAKIRKVSEIYTLSIALSKLLRYSINKHEDKWVSFEKELEHLRYYVDAQKIRFGDKVTVNWEIDEGIIEQKTIKLVLQPLVENAFMHGLEPKGGGTIDIIGNVDQEQLIWEIRDDGVGMTEVQLQLLRDSLHQTVTRTSEQIKSGIGFFNVHQRVLLTFGPPYGLEVQSEVGKGTTVRLILPIVSRGEEHVPITHCG